MMFLFVPEWLTGFNFLMALFGFVLVAAGALLVLVLRGRTEVSGIQLDRAVAAEALVKTRDAELLAAIRERDETEEELESVTAEHRTLAGIKIGELMVFWAQKEDMEAKMLDLERQLRIERKRKDGET